MLRTGLTLVSLALLVVSAACGDDASNVNYPPFPPNTPAPDGSPMPMGPDADLGPMDPVLNEISVADTGVPDTEDFVEVYGSPDTDYSAYTILGIEGDNSGQGVIEYVATVGTTDEDGFFTTSLPSQELEQSAQTFLLVEDFTGALNDDIDDAGGAGDAGDGTIDTEPWTAILDSVALDDASGTNTFYNGTEGPVLLRDGNGGIARITDGADTDAAGDWAFFPEDGTGVDSGDANRTPGASNTVVP